MSQTTPKYKKDFLQCGVNPQNDYTIVILYKDTMRMYNYLEYRESVS